MQKVVIEHAGSHDRLRLQSGPTPTTPPGHARIRVAAIGVNYADCVVRMGLYASAKHYVGWPITPGFEVAGHVDAVGEGVEDLRAGQPAMAVTRFGGYASEVVIPRGQVFPIPGGFSLPEAAAFPTAHLTAWYAMHELAQPGRDDPVLVHSAAGGVGSALLRLARRRGCRVVAVVGHSSKLEHAERSGASIVIDKSTTSLWEAASRAAPEGYRAIFDANGPSTLRDSYRHLAPTGRLVIYGFHSMFPRRGGRPRWMRLALDWLRMPRFDPLDLTGSNKSVMGFNLSYLFDRQSLLRHAMDDLLAAVAAGDLGPPSLTQYPLSQVARAHQRLESGMTTGKLVLIPDRE